MTKIYIGVFATVDAAVSILVGIYQCAVQNKKCLCSNILLSICLCFVLISFHAGNTLNLFYHSAIIIFYFAVCYAITVYILVASSSPERHYKATEYKRIVLSSFIAVTLVVIAIPCIGIIIPFLTDKKDPEDKVFFTLLGIKRHSAGNIASEKRRYYFWSGKTIYVGKSFKKVFVLRISIWIMFLFVFIAATYQMFWYGLAEVRYNVPPGSCDDEFDCFHSLGDILRGRNEVGERCIDTYNKSGDPVVCVRLLTSSFGFSGKLWKGIAIAYAIYLFCLGLYNTVFKVSSFLCFILSKYVGSCCCKFLTPTRILGFTTAIGTLGYGASLGRAAERSFKGRLFDGQFVPILVFGSLLFFAGIGLSITLFIAEYEDKDENDEPEKWRMQLVQEMKQSVWKIEEVWQEMETLVTAIKEDAQSDQDMKDQLEKVKKSIEGLNESKKEIREYLREIEKQEQDIEESVQEIKLMQLQFQKMKNLAQKVWRSVWRMERREETMKTWVGGKETVEPDGPKAQLEKELRDLFEKLKEPRQKMKDFSWKIEKKVHEIEQPLQVQEVRLRTNEHLQSDWRRMGALPQEMKILIRGICTQTQELKDLGVKITNQLKDTEMSEPTDKVREIESSIMVEGEDIEKNMRRLELLVQKFKYSMQMPNQSSQDAEKQMREAVQGMTKRVKETRKSVKEMKNPIEKIEERSKKERMMEDMKRLEQSVEEMDDLIQMLKQSVEAMKLKQSVQGIKGQIGQAVQEMELVVRNCGSRSEAD